GALEDLVPRLAAVGGLVDAALVAVAPELAGDAELDVDGVGGVYEDLGDALGLFEAEVGPVVAAVGRLVDAVADGDAVARPGLAAADPDDFRGLRLDADDDK